MKSIVNFVLFLSIIISGCVSQKRPVLPTNSLSEMTYLATTARSNPNIYASSKYVAIPLNNREWNIYESETLNIVKERTEDIFEYTGVDFLQTSNVIRIKYLNSKEELLWIDLESGARYGLNFVNAYRFGEYIYFTNLVRDDGYYISLEKYSLAGKHIKTLHKINLLTPSLGGALVTYLLGGNTKSQVADSSVTADSYGNVYWAVNKWWVSSGSNCDPDLTSDLFIFENGENFITDLEYDQDNCRGYLGMSRYRNGAILPYTQEYVDFKTLMRKKVDFPDNFVKASMHHIFYIDESNKIYYTSKDYN